VINPTVVGERWRLSWHESFTLPRISKITSIAETDSEMILN
jgi:hypothetical protein